MGRAGSGAAALVTAVLVGASGARADVVTLADGRTLEGKVEELGGGRLVVRGRLGEVVVARGDVVRVERLPTVDERYALERRLTDLDDPRDLERLAAWCREAGLVGEAQALAARAAALVEARAAARREAEAQARRDALAERRRRAHAAGEGAGEALYQAARWAEAQGYGRGEVDALLREALLADPELARARVAAELRRLEVEAQAARDAAARTLAEARAELGRVEGARRAAEAREARAAGLEAAVAAREGALADRAQALAAREEALAAGERTLDARLADAAAARDEARATAARALERERAAVSAATCARDLERRACALRDEAQALLDRRRREGDAEPSRVHWVCTRCRTTFR